MTYTFDLNSSRLMMFIWFKDRLIGWIRNWWGDQSGNWWFSGRSKSKFQTFRIDVTLRFWLIAISSYWNIVHWNVNWIDHRMLHSSYSWRRGSWSPEKSGSDSIDIRPVEQGVNGVTGSVGDGISMIRISGGKLTAGNELCLRWQGIVCVSFSNRICCAGANSKCTYCAVHYIVPSTPSILPTISTGMST